MTIDHPLRVGPLTIPTSELTWRFDTSGGPGGQHANRTASRVELSFDLAGSASIGDALRNQMINRLADGLPTVW